tara:strand:- start:545 stop:1657 length:1113 start_codon:yes stop_codon:yes gene_type:complete
MAFEPRIERLAENDGTLTVSFSNTNYSVVNALRRTILTDIPIVCFKTFPYTESNCEIIKNTSQLNNEIIKHRLSCIPVHLDPDEDHYKNIKVIINKKNDTDEIIYVTTKDIILIDSVSDKQIPPSEVSQYFPPNELTKDYIDIVRLKPKLSKDIPGEELYLESSLTVSTAKVTSAFNVVSLCSYINTPDAITANEKWIEIEKKMISDKVSKEDISYKKEDWFNLDANRIFIENSFEFSIETIGVFTNVDIIKKACVILKQKLVDLEEKFKADNIIINKLISTGDNVYETILEEIDHTLGKIIEYALYQIYYESRKTISLCGFYKKHPHDNFSIIKIAFNDEVDNGIIRDYFVTSITECINIFEKFIDKLK